MRRTIGTFLMSVAVAILWPAVADAQTFPSCKTFQAIPFPEQAPLAKDADPATPRPYVARGTPGGLIPYVTLECDSAQLFADEVEMYADEHLFKARGHVTFIDGGQRITADRLEFNTETKLGTFWNASGIMTIADKPDPKSLLGTTEADGYFFGEKIEKVGVDKYVLTNGRFTTCVQPTPRWELVSHRIVIVRNKHATMSNAVMRVKDVPVMYLPWMYYPVNKGDRATGFLMPQYGHDILRGQMFSSAFFWAIGRSQDVTLNYEFSSKAGKGYGGEYRYSQAPGSDGSARVAVFNGNPNDTTGLFGARTYQVAGSMVQRLPARLEFRSVVDYTNNILTQQVQAGVNSYSTRSAAANLRGSYGRVLLDAQAGFRDVFYSADHGSRYGNAPRLGLAISQSPIGHSKIYVGANSEFNTLIRQDNLNNPLSSRNLTRVDFNPTIRAPIGSLPFLSLTTSAGYRYTTWSEQLNKAGKQVPGTIQRQLFEFGADITGPTFTKVFDTPGSRYATRWKHIVQPSFSIQKTTAFADRALVPLNDAVDTIVGGVTAMQYGLTNRLLAKRPTAGGVAVAQEVASIQIQQTYYSDAAASRFDTSYQSSLYNSGLNPFSPVSIQVAVQPTTKSNFGLRMEYDTKFHALRSTSATVGINAPVLNLNAGWSKLNQLSAATTGETITTAAFHTLTASAAIRTVDRRFSGRWDWNFDIRHKRQLQQHFSAAYMSQCCGLAVEYTYFNLGGLQIAGVQQNKRFNISFSLAGIGTFTNLLGAFGR
jgi:lipopolysaccharide assembly outer membrane protein LptD (OstA)